LRFLKYLGTLSKKFFNHSSWVGHDFLAPLVNSHLYNLNLFNMETHKCARKIFSNTNFTM